MRLLSRHRAAVAWYSCALFSGAVYLGNYDAPIGYVAFFALTVCAGEGLSAHERGAR